MAGLGLGAQYGGWTNFGVPRQQSIVCFYWLGRQSNSLVKSKLPPLLMDLGEVLMQLASPLTAVPPRNSTLCPRSIQRSGGACQI